MDWIECAANIGIACELVYATDKPPWAYNIKNAIKAATVVIADPAHKHLMISGLLSLVTYQLVDPTKTIHDCLVRFISLTDQPQKVATDEMLKILPAQLPVVTANIDAIEQMSAINREIIPIPDIVVEAHIRYHTAFKQYCIMLKQLLEQTLKNTEQYAIYSAVSNMQATVPDSTAMQPNKFKTDIEGFIYFMMCFDPRNEFVPLYAPDDLSPDPAEIAMVRKLAMMKGASKCIAVKGVDEHSYDFGNTLQSFCVFVYKMSTQPVPTVAVVQTGFTEDYGADSYLFGQYCSDYYALVSTLHVDHVKIAQKWWLQLIAVMYNNPAAFKNNRDDYMRTEIANKITRMNRPGYNPDKADLQKNRTDKKLRLIGFLRARIYVAAGALAQPGSNNTLVQYVQSNIKLDHDLIQALSDIKGRSDIKGSYTVPRSTYKGIKIGDFVQTLVDIKRSLVIPDSKGHTCKEFSWCYKCQTIQRSQRELERFREFGIINTDDKRVLAQIKFEQQHTDPMPVISLTDNTNRMVELQRRDMNSTDTDALPS